MLVSLIKEAFLQNATRTNRSSSTTEVQLFPSIQGYYLPEEEDIKLSQELLDLLKNHTKVEGGLKQKEIKNILKGIKNISLDEFVDIGQILLEAICHSKKISDKQKIKLLNNVIDDIRQRAIDIGVDTKTIDEIAKFYGDKNKLQTQRHYSHVLVKYIEAIISKSKEANEDIRNKNIDRNIANINKINSLTRASLKTAESFYKAIPKEDYDFSEEFARDFFISTRENISKEEYIERMKGNGRIDEKFWQTFRGNCWAVGTMNAMLTSEIGTEILNSHIKKIDGGFLIHLGKAAKKNLPADGVPGVYFISEKEVFEEGPLQSMGDGDATALLLAIKKYKTETGDYSSENLSFESQQNLETVNKHKNIINTLEKQSKEEIITNLNSLSEDLNQIYERLSEQSVRRTIISNLQNIIQENLSIITANTDNTTGQVDLLKIKNDINYWLDKILILTDTDVMNGEAMKDFFEILTGIDAEPEQYTTMNAKMSNFISDKKYRHPTPKANEDLPIGICVRSFDYLSDPDSSYAKFQKLHNEGRIAMTFEVSSGLENNRDNIEIFADTEGREYTGIEPMISQGHNFEVIKIEDDYIWLQEPNTPNAYIRCTKEAFLDMGAYAHILRYY